jgi:hypothetical protein
MFSTESDADPPKLFAVSRLQPGTAMTWGNCWLTIQVLIWVSCVIAEVFANCVRFWRRRSRIVTNLGYAIGPNLVYGSFGQGTSERLFVCGPT